MCDRPAQHAPQLRAHPGNGPTQAAIDHSWCALLCRADMNTEILAAIANATSIDLPAEGGNLTRSTVSALLPGAWACCQGVGIAPAAGLQRDCGLLCWACTRAWPSCLVPTKPLTLENYMCFVCGLPFCDAGHALVWLPQPHLPGPEHVSAAAGTPARQLTTPRSVLTLRSSHLGRPAGQPASQDISRSIKRCLLPPDHSPNTPA